MTNTKQFNIVTSNLMEASRAVYGSYGYGAGFFRSLAVQMYQLLPEHERKTYLEQMIDAEKTMFERLEANKNSEHARSVL